MRIAARSHARVQDPDTSHFAAETSLQDGDTEILEILAQADATIPRGHTPREVVEIMIVSGSDHQSINSRFSRLRDAGVVRYLLNKDGSIVKRITAKSGKPGRVHIVVDGRHDSIFKPPTRLEVANLKIKILQAENAKLRVIQAELDGFLRVNRVLRQRMTRRV